MAETITFMKAMSQEFGKKEGQNLADFAKELKELNASDKAYFVERFKIERGVTIVL